MSTNDPSPLHARVFDLAEETEPADTTKAPKPPDVPWVTQFEQETREDLVIIRSDIAALRTDLLRVHKIFMQIQVEERNARKALRDELTAKMDGILKILRNGH